MLRDVIVLLIRCSISAAKLMYRGINFYSLNMCITVRLLYTCKMLSLLIYLTDASLGWFRLRCANSVNESVVVDKPVEDSK